MTLPEQLLKDLQGINGFNESEFKQAHEEAALTSIRLHPKKSATTLVAGTSVPWSNGGIYLADRPVFTLDPLYHAGAYYVQEASSMFLEYLLGHLLPDTGGLRVLDLCAAPGGKSTLLAGIIGDDSLLISNEVIRSRATILEENMVRWGCTNSWVTCNDPISFGQLPGYFDVIVVDAPCSGSGLFRKDERALKEWSTENVELCSGRQQRILADIWPALKENGILIYATCSYSPQEDEEILDWLATTYDVETLQAPINDDWGVVEVMSPEKKCTGYRFFPGKVKGEGFFIAGLRKKEASEKIKPAKFKPVNSSRIMEQAKHLLGNGLYQIINAGKDNYSAINPAHEADLMMLQKSLYFRKTGLNIGSPTTKEWLPAHEVALSVDANKLLPSFEVTKEQALKFLKREDMQLSQSAKGWHIIKFNNLGLGWVKALDNRVNNYLPKHWRIRMQLPDEELIT